MTSLVFFYLFVRDIPLLMLLSGVYILRTKGYDNFQRILAIIVIPASLSILVYIFIKDEGLKNKIVRYKEIKNLKSVDVDSIIYESKKDRILVLNREVINNIVTHYNEMESTLNYGHSNLKNSFDLYIYAKNEIKLEHNYSGLGNLIIEIPGVGEYYSEGLGYFMTKEYLSTPAVPSSSDPSASPDANYKKEVY